MISLIQSHEMNVPTVVVHGHEQEVTGTEEEPLQGGTHLGLGELHQKH